MQLLTTIPIDKIIYSNFNAGLQRLLPDLRRDLQAAHQGRKVRHKEICQFKTILEICFVALL